MKPCIFLSLGQLSLTSYAATLALPSLHLAKMPDQFSLHIKKTGISRTFDRGAWDWTKSAEN